ncbi:hypothetical protein B0H13DRAFT_2351202 [Mycena leptocephala]|nr:hypothetical protein B0H13DRAFT_2380579 [Mycena leptocephala]KAJ7868907.1 hypothetical protein B0H13DRAFT_2351202 [Mycena leptocephala]
MQRIDGKVVDKWRLPALCVTFVFLLSFYFFRLGGWHTPALYQDLVTATTNTNCAAPFTLGGSTRLARTLVGNEKRYQYTLVEREKIIEKSGGMQINVFPPKNQLANLLWDFFIPAFSCPFPMSRVGIFAEGGKWVCGLDRVLQHRPNPIIYSLNHETPSYSSFEQDILERSPGVQIYAFDADATPEAASAWPWGEADVTTDFLRSRVQFNHFSIADPTAKTYQSLHSVMHGFGHEWIDILKVELKGSEFATLLAIIAEYGDGPLPFGQLLIKVQTGLSDDMRKVEQFSNWFTRLECAGLRPYYFEISMLDANNRRDEPSLVYWSFMNIRGRHVLVDDGLPEYP